MSYLYYPGCSLKSTGRPYEESMLAVCKALQIPMEEVEDWNCCGATAYIAVDEDKAYALAARNLALAERQKQNNGSTPTNLVAPCNACYLVLMKAQHYITENGHRIREALKQGRLEYHGKVQVRHPLDVFVNDIGLEKIKAQVKEPLSDLRVACYYGCQIVRPYATFDDQYNPTAMDRLMETLGAESIAWPLKTRCCGGSLTGTIEEVGLRLSYFILKEAQKRGANVVATACPLCQLNLECYQDRMNRLFQDDLRMPVVYFTQLIGKAFGISDREIGLHRLFVPLQPETALV